MDFEIKTAPINRGADWEHLERLTPEKYSSLMKELEDFQGNAAKYSFQVETGDWDSATDTYIQMRDKWGKNPNFSGLLYTLRDPVNQIDEEYDESRPDFINNLRKLSSEMMAKKRTREALNGIARHRGTVAKMWDKAHTA